ncbi:MAG TPA: hypothetical protein VGC79_04825, partial [Polyangiaceae bacterium]
MKRALDSWLVGTVRLVAVIARRTLAGALLLVPLLLAACSDRGSPGSASAQPPLPRSAARERAQQLATLQA